MNDTEKANFLSSSTFIPSIQRTTIPYRHFSWNEVASAKGHSRVREESQRFITRILESRGQDTYNVIRTLVCRCADRRKLVTSRLVTLKILLYFCRAVTCTRSVSQFFIFDWIALFFVFLSIKFLTLLRVIKEGLFAPRASPETFLELTGQSRTFYIGTLMLMLLEKA